MLSKGNNIFHILETKNLLRDLLLVSKAKILVEDGSGDADAEVGELCIKSPSLFKEYWKLPEVLVIIVIDRIYLKKRLLFSHSSS